MRAYILWHSRPRLSGPRRGRAGHIGRRPSSRPRLALLALAAAIAGLCQPAASGEGPAPPPPSPPPAPTPEGPVDLDLRGDWGRQFDVLAARLAARDKQPVAEQVFRRAALILPDDRDPLDVVLRQARALLQDLLQLGPKYDLAPAAAGLARLEAEARTVAPEMEEHPGARGQKVSLPAKDGARYALYLRACALRRNIAFANPLLDFAGILFVKHAPNSSDNDGGEGTGNHMAGQYYGFMARRSPHEGLFVLEDCFAARPRLRNVLAGAAVHSGRLAGKPLPPGAFLAPDLSFDAKTALFAYTQAAPAQTQGRERYRWVPEVSWHVFRANVDGVGLAQLTDGPRNDFHPCFLPNGRIVFVSDRRGGYGRCHPYPWATYTLHTMNPDGSDILRISDHETCEWRPSLTNDGLIVYTRWDYVDRGFHQAHHPWLTTPDGHDARVVHGNFPPNWRLRPNMEMDIRAIPNSAKFVATAAPHHGEAYGSLVLVDPDIEDDDKMAPVKRLTPEAPFPESAGRGQPYGTAWPLSEDYFLCVYDPGGGTTVCDYRAHRYGLITYGIYLLDSFGNRELLYRDPHIACLSPIPLRPRLAPPVLPARASNHAEADHEGAPAAAPGLPRPPPEALDDARPAGLFSCMSVYDGLLPWPDGTRLKALRIIQVLPKTTPQRGQPRIGLAPETSARAVLGTVPVEADGSACFIAPANIPLYFQALDERGLAVQSMLSLTYVQPGAHLACAGCHDRRWRSPCLPAGVPLALRRAPARITPDAEGSRPFSFPRLVQPVLQSNCQACHAKEPKAPKLTDARAAHRSLGRYVFVNGANSTFSASRSIPGRIGARGSKLFQLLEQGHHEVKLAAPDLHRLTLWMDCNGDFYGAYENTAAQDLGEIVKPSVE